MLSADVQWGIGNTGCHDIVAQPTPVADAPESEGYVQSVDLETGELSVRPIVTE